MEKGLVRCQRIGCDAMFDDDSNPDGSCRFHDSPIFHDGMKEWSCCQQRSHDFGLFLAIPGCKTGKHTTEKPVTQKVSSQKKPVPIPVAADGQINASKADCSRCQQGFFCSDHGSQAPVINSKSSMPIVTPPENNSSAERIPAGAVKKINLNEPQICRNNGCGKTFKEKDNYDSACEYHPGPAIFHDRVRGWKCCNIYVKEFDEFMSIPPCTEGWHNANPPAS